MTKRRFQSPKSIMWNEETREALFHLLRQNGYPVYSLWDAVMRPGVKVLPTQQHWEILEVTAQQMQALYPHFLLRSPDRRRYADQEYTPTGLEAQAAFAIQQGIKYNNGNGYEHEKLGHVNTAISCLRAALKTGFMKFSEIHPKFHKYIVVAYQTEGSTIPAEELTQIESLPAQFVARTAKEIITNTIITNTKESAMTPRERELIIYALNFVRDAIDDGTWQIVDLEHRCRVTPEHLQAHVLSLVEEFREEDGLLDVFDEIAELPSYEELHGSPACVEETLSPDDSCSEVIDFVDTTPLNLKTTNTLQQ